MKEPADTKSPYQGIEKNLTRHAWERMTSRGVSPTAVTAVLDYGRLSYVRGAAIHAIGHKEVGRFAKKGINLSPYEGIQVVCTPGGRILTVYKNRNFRGLRPSRRR